MKKYLTSAFLFALAFSPVMAQQTVFDSMDNATEVKLAPANSVTIPKTQANTVTNTNNAQKVNAVYATSTIKEQKFNDALVNLDDAQVELRQELSVATSKYNEAMIEKARICASCKTYKNEMKSISRKMKNVDKSKKMINKNLETAK